MNGLQLLKKVVMGWSGILCHLPEKCSTHMAASAGLAAWIAWKSERRRIEDCVDRIYFRLNRVPPLPIKEIVRRSFVHFALVANELMLFPALDAATLREKMQLKDLHNLNNALARKKGVILALPHIGNWEILGTALVNAGYPLHSFYLAQKADAIGGLLDHFRSYSGIILYDRDRGGIKGLKALRQGEMLGMIADQDGANNGVYMNFLGHWVSMPAGPANWSLKTGAALVPLYSLRNNLKGSFVGRILPAMSEESDKPGESHAQRVIARTVRLARWMEDIILANPHQYLWFYDRFKPRHEAWITDEKIKNGQMLHGVPRYGS